MAKLKHARLKNATIAVPGEVLELDAKGEVEVKDDKLAKALEKTGNFQIIEEKKKDAPKEEDEPKKEVEHKKEDKKSTPKKDAPKKETTKKPTKKDDKK